MSGARRRLALLTAGFLLGIAVPASRAGAQDVPLAPEPLSSVVGRVVVARAGEEPRPIPGTWVALSRIGNDTAGVIDSVRTASDGAYRFTYRRFGDPDAIYFTDATYGGVAYFTDPLRGLNVTGEDADLVVFDTVSAPAGAKSPLRVRGRHFVVGAALPRGRRAVVEVFELTNDTSLTIVPRSDVDPVWSAALVPGAEQAEVGDGDVSASVVHFRDGRAELFAPIAPGLRQLSIHYTVPESAFPLTLALPDSLEVLEVLLAGSGGTATGAGLHAERGVTIEEEPYARFLSRQAEAGDEVVIRIAGSAAERFAVPLVIGLSVLVFAAALVHVRRTTYRSSHN
ncbi:MAG: hypothetical protein H0X64_00410 [Gemmatimonadaceae bacterium]|nr:hypothetical protein [Gemmatimonadaceae bacterium]